MRAVVLEEHGGPDVLRLREVPEPTIGPEEVLVEIISTAVNRADLLQRMGLYPGPPAEFEIPGLELAGRVVAVGERVVERRVGDVVMAITNGGAYAERTAIHERMAMPVPDCLGLDVAGALPETFITAWDALVVQGGLTAGRWALVHAGASGVGTSAIQIVKAIGARVIVTASAGKHHVCESLGADVVVDYATEDFVDSVSKATGGAGVDVVLDVIGGNYVDRNVASLRTGGRVIQVGLMAGGRVPFDVGVLLMKRAALIGTTLRARPLEEKIALTRRFSAEMLTLVASGVMAPVVDSRYRLADIADAHRRMETNVNAGKIVIEVAPHRVGR